MKIKAFTLLLLSLSLSFITSCDKDEETKVEATGIVLDQSELSIEKESTTLLTATLTPSGATGDIEWSSSDPSVAAVVDGIVTALKIGEATVVATHGAFSANCVVTVTPKELDPGDLPESLQGSDYYIVHLDESTSPFIEGKISEDFRPDEVSKFLYVWDDTFSAGTPNGLNFYDQAEGWVSLIVGNVGWSGAGYNVSADYGEIDMTNLYNNPEDYVFHIALKSGQEYSSFMFIFSDGTSEAKIVVGPAPLEDIAPTMEFPRDNEWHSLEIPVTKLNELGVFYNEPFSDVNIFAFLAGGVQGVTLDLDACFFYKKAK